MEKINIKVPMLVAIVVLLLWAFTWFLLVDEPDRGTFGDMFGAVNALFSGLAFAGVIFAILLQRQELALQRTELELTRKELSGQRKEMEMQNKTMKKQSFENTFFQMLSLHQQIVNSIDLIGANNRTTVGRDCFSVFYKRFRNSWKEEIKKKSSDGMTKLEFVNYVYGIFLTKHQSEIGHYFRYLYHIVKLIDNSDVEDKRLYSNLVRAQLSSYELVLLFYNCLSDIGKEKFKPLLEKYGLLKNMEKSLLIDSHDHPTHYSTGAFE